MWIWMLSMHLSPNSITQNFAAKLSLWEQVLAE
jgi:hypothetical protein